MNFPVLLPAHLSVALTPLLTPQVDRILTKGITGIEAALVTVAAQPLFLKWVRENAPSKAYEELSSEARNRMSLGDLDFAPQLLLYDPDASLAVYEGIPGGVDVVWTNALAKRGLKILDHLAGLDSSMVPDVRFVKPVSTGLYDSLQSLGLDAQKISDCYVKYREMEATVPAHFDAHPDNWVIDKSGKLWLVDFAKTRLAPVGWDSVLFLSHLPLDAHYRLSLLIKRVPTSKLLTLTGAAVATLAVPSKTPNVAWDRHRARFLPHAVDLYEAVRQIGNNS